MKDSKPESSLSAEAVIFDFDGVLVDTEPLHYQAFQKVLAPYGCTYSWEDYLAVFVGFDDRDAFREAFKHAGRVLDEAALEGLIRLKASAFARLAEQGASAYPGALELLHALRGRIPLGLCSGSLRSDILPILKKLNCESVFDALVAADDVTCSKPDPESYEKILRLFQARSGLNNLRAADCLAIEDTPEGIASAHGAGMRVLAVCHSLTAEQLQGADYRVGDLQEALPMLRQNIDPGADAGQAGGGN